MRINQKENCLVINPSAQGMNNIFPSQVDSTLDCRPLCPTHFRYIRRKRNKFFTYMSLVAMQVALLGAPTVTKASSIMSISQQNDDSYHEGGEPPLKSNMSDSDTQLERLKELGFEPSHDKPNNGEFFLSRYKTAPGFEYLSPTNVVQFLDLNILENIRLSGNYGHPGEALFRPSKDPTHLSRDCAHDPVATFIQFLFPSGDLTQLNLTTNSSDFVFTLKPEKIGHILRIITPYHHANEAEKKEIARGLFSLFADSKKSKSFFDKEINNKIKAKRTELILDKKGVFIEEYSQTKDAQDAINILYKVIKSGESLTEADHQEFLETVLNPVFKKKYGKYLRKDAVGDDAKSFQNAYKVISDAYKNHQNAIKNDIDHEVNSYQNNLLLEQKIEKLTSKEWVSSSLKPLMAALKKAGNSNQKDGLKRDPYYFIGMLFQALELENQEGSIYPEQTVEKSLLALAWRKTNGQESEVDKVMAPLKGLVERDKKPSFPLTQDNYFKFKEFVEEKGTNAISEIFEADPDFAFFIQNGMNKYEASLPKVLNYGYASVDNKNNAGDVIKFPDCGSTSLRNFLNILLFDASSRHFSVEHLENLGDQGGRFQEIIAYYKHYNTPDLMLSQRARDDFAKITSGLDNVSYTKRNFAEINPGLKNMFQVFLEIAPNLFGETRDIKTQAYEILSTFTDNVKRPELTIQWDVPKDKKTHQPKIDFTNNKKGIMNLPFALDKKEIEWQFLDAHFNLKYESNEVTWQRAIHYKLAESFEGDFTTQSPLYFYQSSLMVETLKDKPSKDFWISLWRADLNNDEEIKKAISTYVEKRSEASFTFNDDVFLKLLSKLQLEDQITRMFLFMLMEKNPENLKIEGKIPERDQTLAEYRESLQEDFAKFKPIMTDNENGNLNTISKLKLNNRATPKQIITLGTLLTDDMSPEAFGLFDEYGFKTAEQITATRNLFTDHMTVLDREGILKVLYQNNFNTSEQLIAIRSLFTDKIMFFHRQRIITQLAQNGFTEPEQITALSNLFTADMLAVQREGIIEGLAQHNFKTSEQITAIGSLFTDKIIFSHRLNVIDVLAKKGFTEPEQITAIGSLVWDGMSPEDRTFLIEKLALNFLTTPEQLTALGNLFTDKIIFYHRLNVIDLLAKKGFTEPEQITAIGSLLWDDMSPEGRTFLIEKLALNFLTTPEQLTALGNLFTADMNGSDRFSILSTLFYSKLTSVEQLLALKEIFTEGMRREDFTDIIKVLVKEGLTTPEQITAIGSLLWDDMTKEDRENIIRNLAKND